MVTPLRRSAERQQRDEVADAAREVAARPRARAGPRRRGARARGAVLVVQDAPGGRRAAGAGGAPTFASAWSMPRAAQRPERSVIGVAPWRRWPRGAPARCRTRPCRSASARSRPRPRPGRRAPRRSIESPSPTQRSRRRPSAGRVASAAVGRDDEVDAVVPARPGRVEHGPLGHRAVGQDRRRAWRLGHGAALSRGIDGSRRLGVGPRRAEQASTNSATPG